MTKDQALVLALTALHTEGEHHPRVYEAMDAIQTVLTQPVQEQQQVGPVEDMLLRRAVLRSAKIVSDGRFVTKQAALEQPPLPVQPEPVTWDKPSASFNEWWNGDYEDPANPFEKDSHGYWAWAGWQAAQTVQEPVAWLYPEGLEALQNGKCWTTYPTEHEDCNIPLYIALPQRQWVGLTVTTILNMMPSTIPADYDGELMEFARAVEAKLKEKNHG